MEVSPQRVRYGDAPHLVGVNELGVRVFVEARRRSDEFDSWDHEVALQCGPRAWVTPDAVFNYVERFRQHLAAHCWLIEYDRGTESIERLVEKVLAYQDLREFRDKDGFRWRRHFSEWPKIVFVFDTVMPQMRMENFAARVTNDSRVRDLQSLGVFVVSRADFVESPLSTNLRVLPALTKDSLLVQPEALTHAR